MDGKVFTVNVAGNEVTLPHEPVMVTLYLLPVIDAVTLLRFNVADVAPLISL